MSFTAAVAATTSSSGETTAAPTFDSTALTDDVIWCSAVGDSVCCSNVLQRQLFTSFQKHPCVTNIWTNVVFCESLQSKIPFLKGKKIPKVIYNRTQQRLEFPNEASSNYHQQHHMEDWSIGYQISNPQVIISSTESKPMALLHEKKSFFQKTNDLFQSRSEHHSKNQRLSVFHSVHLQTSFLCFRKGEYFDHVEMEWERGYITMVYPNAVQIRITLQLVFTRLKSTIPTRTPPSLVLSAPNDSTHPFKGPVLLNTLHLKRNESFSHPMIEPRCIYYVLPTQEKTIQEWYSALICSKGHYLISDKSDKIRYPQFQEWYHQQMLVRPLSVGMKRLLLSSNKIAQHHSGTSVESMWQVTTQDLRYS